MEDLGAWIVFAFTGGISAFLVVMTIRFGQTARRTKARLQRMAHTSTTRIADATPDRVIEVLGEVTPAGDVKLLEAPLSGTRCVWWRVEVDESVGSSINRLVQKSEACDFDLDDGSGRRARITMRHAAVRLGARNVIPALEERARAFLDEHGVTKERAVNVKDLLWFEERIDPGQSVYVLGRVSTMAPIASEGPFRGKPSSGRWVIGEPPGGELVVGLGAEADVERSEEKVLADAMSGFKVTGAIAAVMTLLTVGVLLGILSYH